jgi:hypothetical protein
MVHYISTILNSCYETIRDEGRHIMLAKVAQPLYNLDLFNILLGFHLSAIPFQLWAVKIAVVRSRDTGPITEKIKGFV